MEESFTPEITGKVLPKMSEQYANNLGSQTRVIVEVDSKLSWRAFDELEVLEHLENENLRCVVNIPDISWGISYLLSFGSGIKVIEPDSVKNMLLQEIEKMLKNAEIIEDHAGSDEVGLNKVVKIYIPEDEEEEEYKIVITDFSSFISTLANAFGKTRSLYLKSISLDSRII